MAGFRRGTARVAAALMAAMCAASLATWAVACVARGLLEAAGAAVGA